jgi:two-component system cell cycle sensor histidine kinase/response regulator CckA
MADEEQESTRLAVGGPLGKIQTLAEATGALIQSERRYRVLVETCPDGILVLDSRRVVIQANECGAQMFGYPGVDQLLREADSFVSRVVEEDRVRVAEQLDQAATGARVRHVAFRLRRESDNLPVEMSASRLEDDKAPSAQLIAVLRDTSERLRAEERRRRLEAQMQVNQRLQSLAILVGQVAHDFNNLLTGIAGHAELALRDLKGAPSAARIGEVLRLTNEAGELTGRMLGSAGRARLLAQPVKLASVVADAVQTMRASLPPSVQLMCNVRAGLPAVDADAAQLSQALVSLFCNALEALDRGQGRVEVRGGVVEIGADELASYYLHEHLEPGRHVYVEVADNGCGMSVATEERMFEPFFSTRVDGRGLGLAGVLGIVRGHRGAIKVWTKVGEGTRVRIVFPPAQSKNQSPSRGGRIG